MPNGHEPPHVYAQAAADHARERASEVARDLSDLHLDVEWIKGVLASKGIATVAELTRLRPPVQVLSWGPEGSEFFNPGRTKFGLHERVIVRQGRAQGTVVGVSRSMHPRDDGADVHYDVKIPGLGQLSLAEDDLEAIQCEEIDEEQEQETS